MSIPDAYTFKTAFDLVDADGLRARHAQCMVLSEKTGRLYVADTDNNRILIYSADFRLEKVLTDFPYENDTLQLNQPEGIYVYDNGDLLVADTQNGRILQCREDGTVFKILEKPANMTGLTGGDEAFLPSRLAVDSIGRMYVVARNINRGIIQLDSEGRFMGYIGSPRVQYDVMTVLLRRFFTETQKAKLEQFVPTEYNSIFMDDEDFLWSTISSLDGEDILNAIRSKDKSGTVTPIKKLNTMGNDVLKRNGFYAPLGDLDFKEEPSRIVGVAVGQNGIYSLLDQQRGHIFTYDDNGNLLFILEISETEKAIFKCRWIFGIRGTICWCWTADLERCWYSSRRPTASWFCRRRPVSLTAITRKPTSFGRSWRGKTPILSTRLWAWETLCSSRGNTMRRSSIFGMPRIKTGIPIRLLSFGNKRCKRIFPL